jgi:hypothetical protein
MGGTLMAQGTGTIASLNGTVATVTEGFSTASFSVTGTWSGALILEATIDDINWFTIQGLNTAIASLTSIFGSSAFQVTASCGSFSQVRLRAYMYTSGTANVAWDTSQGDNSIAVVTDALTSTNPPSYAPGFFVPLSLNTLGALRTELLISSKPTYSASIVSLTPPATPTDMVVISGSATKTIRVTKVELSATQTLSGTNNFFIVLRSAADSGGTSSTLTNIAHDSNNAAATSVVKSYTANPSLGAAVGTLRAIKMFTPAPGTLTTPYIFDFTNDGIDQGIVLRGTAQQLSLNFNGAALPGGLSITCNIDWSEE